MYSSICELAKNQLENIKEPNFEYQSILINLKLINSLFYKIIPIIVKSSNNLHKPYILTTTINQMLIYVDKCNKVSSLIILFFMST